MRYLLAVLMTVHGMAHLVGFVVPWKLVNLREAPYRTTILAGKVDVGDAGIRVMGLTWLLAAVAFVVVAVGLILDFSWSLPAAALTLGASMALSIVGWPESRLGILINVVLLAILAVGVM